MPASAAAGGRGATELARGAGIRAGHDDHRIRGDAGEVLGVVIAFDRELDGNVVRAAAGVLDVQVVLKLFFTNGNAIVVATSAPSVLRYIPPARPVGLLTTLTIAAIG